MIIITGIFINACFATVFSMHCCWLLFLS